MTHGRSFGRRLTASPPRRAVVVEDYAGRSFGGRYRHMTLASVAHAVSLPAHLAGPWFLTPGRRAA